MQDATVVEEAESTRNVPEQVHNLFFAEKMDADASIRPARRCLAPSAEGGLELAHLCARYAMSTDFVLTRAAGARGRVAGACGDPVGEAPAICCHHEHVQRRHSGSEWTGLRHFDPGMLVVYHIRVVQLFHQVHFRKRAEQAVRIVTDRHLFDRVQPKFAPIEHMLTEEYGAARATAKSLQLDKEALIVSLVRRLLIKT